MNKIIPLVIWIIIIVTELHFTINDDSLNFNWAFECEKTLATVGG